MLLAVFLCFVAIVFGEAPLLRHDLEKTFNRISDGVAQRQMIVVFNKMAPQFGDQETVTNWASLKAGLNAGDINRYYSIGKDFQGFSAWLSESSLSAIRNESIVGYVEEDQIVSLDFTTEPLLPEVVTKMPPNPSWRARVDWGQSRISTRQWELYTTPNPHYSPKPPATYANPYQNVTSWRWVYEENRRPLPSNGQNAVVWIVDTGVKRNHDEFQEYGSDGPVSRVDLAISFVDAEPDPDDGNGHGTHCAGTAAGNWRGVASEAVIRSVKVLGASGSGSWTGVIAGFNYVANNQVKDFANILSASLGGGATQSVDDATNAAVGNGVIAVVAAGNSNNDACGQEINGIVVGGNSPARARQAITVVASDSADNVASFSSFGACCKSIAPGVTVTSAWISPANDRAATDYYQDISGTSMATPHVAGAIAVLTSMNGGPKDPDGVKAHLSEDQTKGLITGLDVPAKSTTPNQLIFAHWNASP
jgi:hypothetical protein